MRMATRTPATRSFPGVRLLLLAVVCQAMLAVTLPAQETADIGRVVQVPMPLDMEAVSLIARAGDNGLDLVEKALRAQPGGPRPDFKLIFDFNPEGKPSNSADFGACYNLKDEIRRVRERGARTIAYVHGSVTRHSVLPVLACDEIVFSREGKLGEVRIAADQQKAYLDAAGSRYPEAVIRKMFDPAVAITRARAGEQGPRFRVATGKGDEDVVLPAGALGLYTFADASAFGLCQPGPQEDVAAVAAAYGVPQAARDPILTRSPVCWLLTVEGPINAELKERLQRRVRRALHNGNLLIFKLKCHGGDSGAAYDLANYIASLNDDRREKVKTIAYVTEEASDNALFLALACSEIVMDRKGKLGDFDTYLRDHGDREATIQKNLEELSKRQLYPKSLTLGFADKSLRIHWAIRKKGVSEGRPMTSDEMADDEASGNPQWRSAWMVKPMTPKDEGRYLTLDAETAVKVGLARKVVDGVDAIYAMEGVKANEVHMTGSDWLDDLADFLRDPWTSMFLVMVGITCLILELKLPGVSLPGIIAAVCFVLFFWSHSQLNGQIAWLAALLFLLGLALLAIEIFVVPGFGVMGISGIVLVIGSLALVAYGHWPQSSSDWVGLGKTMGPFGVCMLGALIAAFMLARYLPNIPFANRLILKPAGEADELSDELPAPGPVSELAGLLGAIGVAATPLRPAGKAQFGDDFVDVVAEGSYVPPGTRVRVIEIEGNRVVVKEV